MALVGAGLLFNLAPPDSAEGGRRLDVYLDSSGIPTSCSGLIGNEVVRRYKLHGTKARFTEAECIAMEKAYTVPMQRQMAACIPDKVKAEITFGEMWTFAHWHWNTGAFCQSSVGRELAKGDHVRACHAMAKYTWARPNPRWRQTGRSNGKIGAARRVDCSDPANKCSGLATRRRNEVAWCLSALDEEVQ
jgi:GH24 family phage-related lysozyme (muramidase)